MNRWLQYRFESLAVACGHGTIEMETCYSGKCSQQITIQQNSSIKTDITIMVMYIGDYRLSPWSLARLGCLVSFSSPKACGRCYFRRSAMFYISREFIQLPHLSVCFPPNSRKPLTGVCMHASVCPRACARVIVHDREYVRTMEREKDRQIYIIIIIIRQPLCPVVGRWPQHAVSKLPCLVLSSAISCRSSICPGRLSIAWLVSLVVFSCHMVSNW